MIIALRVQNSLNHPVMVRTPFASEQPLEANQAVVLTFDYTQDMGEVAIVVEPQ